jgi:hypothetical protein
MPVLGSGVDGGVVLVVVVPAGGAVVVVAAGGAVVVVPAGGAVVVVPPDAGSGTGGVGVRLELAADAVPPEASSATVASRVAAGGCSAIARATL